MNVSDFSPTVLADIVLFAFAIEAIWLIALRRDRRLDAAFTLVPGLCLALALRAALGHAPWLVVAAFLAASGPAHLADLSRRNLIGRRAQTVPRARKPSTSASE
jgi:hypothetical protein